MDYAIEYNGFPIVLKEYNDANWIFDSHLGVMWLYRDQPGK